MTSVSSRRRVSRRPTLLRRTLSRSHRSTVFGAGMGRPALRDVPQTRSSPQAKGITVLSSIGRDAPLAHTKQRSPSSSPGPRNSRRTRAGNNHQVRGKRSTSMASDSRPCSPIGERAKQLDRPRHSRSSRGSSVGYPSSWNLDASHVEDSSEIIADELGEIANYQQVSRRHARRDSSNQSGHRLNAAPTKKLHGRRRLRPKDSLFDARRSGTSTGNATMDNYEELRCLPRQRVYSGRASTPLCSQSNSEAHIPLVTYSCCSVSIPGRQPRAGRSSDRYNRIERASQPPASEDCCQSAEATASDSGHEDNCKIMCCTCGKVKRNSCSKRQSSKVCDNGSRRSNSKSMPTVSNFSCQCPSSMTVNQSEVSSNRASAKVSKSTGYKESPRSGSNSHKATAAKTLPRYANNDSIQVRTKMDSKGNNYTFGKTTAKANCCKHTEGNPFLRSTSSAPCNSKTGMLSCKAKHSAKCTKGTPCACNRGFQGPVYQVPAAKDVRNSGCRSHTTQTNCSGQNTSGRQSEFRANREQEQCSEIGSQASCNKQVQCYCRCPHCGMGWKNSDDQVTSDKGSTNSRNKSSSGQRKAKSPGRKAKPQVGAGRCSKGAAAMEDPEEDLCKICDVIAARKAERECKEKAKKLSMDKCNKTPADECQATQDLCNVSDIKIECECECECEGQAKKSSKDKCTKTAADECIKTSIDECQAESNSNAQTSQGLANLLLRDKCNMNKIIDILQVTVAQLQQQQQQQQQEEQQRSQTSCNGSYGLEVMEEDCTANDFMEYNMSQQSQLENQFNCPSNQMQQEDVCSQNFDNCCVWCPLRSFYPQQQFNNPCQMNGNRRSSGHSQSIYDCQNQAQQFQRNGNNPYSSYARRRSGEDVASVELNKAVRPKEWSEIWNYPLGPIQPARLPNNTMRQPVVSQDNNHKAEQRVLDKITYHSIPAHERRALHTDPSRERVEKSAHSTQQQQRLRQKPVAGAPRPNQQDLFHGWDVDKAAGRERSLNDRVKRREKERGEFSSEGYQYARREGPQKNSDVVQGKPNQDPYPNLQSTSSHLDDGRKRREKGRDKLPIEIYPVKAVKSPEQWQASGQEFSTQMDSKGQQSKSKRVFIHQRKGNEGHKNKSFNLFIPSDSEVNKSKLKRGPKYKFQTKEDGIDNGNSFAKELIHPSAKRSKSRSVNCDRVNQNVEYSGRECIKDTEVQIKNSKEALSLGQREKLEKERKEYLEHKKVKIENIQGLNSRKPPEVKDPGKEHQKLKDPGRCQIGNRNAKEIAKNEVKKIASPGESSKSVGRIKEAFNVFLKSKCKADLEKRFKENLNLTDIIPCTHKMEKQARKVKERAPIPPNKPTRQAVDKSNISYSYEPHVQSESKDIKVLYDSIYKFSKHRYGDSNSESILGADIKSDKLEVKPTTNNFFSMLTP